MNGHHEVHADCKRKYMDETVVNKKQAFERVQLGAELQHRRSSRHDERLGIVEYTSPTKVVGPARSCRKQTIVLCCDCVVQGKRRRYYLVDDNVLVCRHCSVHTALYHALESDDLPRWCGSQSNDARVPQVTPSAEVPHLVGAIRTKYAVSNRQRVCRLEIVDTMQRRR